MLCILAHTDEEIARRAVPMILTMWRRDTRPPPWNDQYTYKLLRADSAFLVGMMAFGSGTPRWDLFFVFIRAANVVRLCKLQIALPPYTNVDMVSNSYNSVREQYMFSIKSSALRAACSLVASCTCERVRSVDHLCESEIGILNTLRANCTIAPVLRGLE